MPAVVRRRGAPPLCSRSTLGDCAGLVEKQQRRPCVVRGAIVIASRARPTGGDTGSSERSREETMQVALGRFEEFAREPVVLCVLICDGLDLLAQRIDGRFGEGE